MRKPRSAGLFVSRERHPRPAVPEIREGPGHPAAGGRHPGDSAMEPGCRCSRLRHHPSSPHQPELYDLSDVVPEAVHVTLPARSSTNVRVPESGCTRFGDRRSQRTSARCTPLPSQPPSARSSTPWPGRSSRPSASRSTAVSAPSTASARPLPGAHPALPARTPTRGRPEWRETLAWRRSAPRGRRAARNMGFRHDRHYRDDVPGHAAGTASHDPRGSSHCVSDDRLGRTPTYAIPTAPASR
jgi:hypothetical protein